MGQALPNSRNAKGLGYESGHCTGREEGYSRAAERIVRWFFILTEAPRLEIGFE
jgi:hypothetical protein